MVNIRLLRRIVRAKVRLAFPWANWPSISLWYRSVQLMLRLGKLCDIFASEADICARATGGRNCGHSKASDQPKGGLLGAST